MRFHGCFAQVCGEHMTKTQHFDESWVTASQLYGFLPGRWLDLA
jgi:hypothetical protein